MSNNIESVECKHVFYGVDRGQGGWDDDAVFVKERIHYKDGTSKPNFRMIKNFQRDFYITRKGFRNHEQKKSFEYIDRCIKGTSNHRTMGRAIAKAMGNPGLPPNVRRLAESPYLYGTDIDMESYVKMKYQERFPDKFTPNDVAVLDIETDVVKKYKGEINRYIKCAAITFRDKAFLAVDKNWVERELHEYDGEEGLRKAIIAAFKKYLPKDVEERKINLEIEICENDALCAKRCIEKGHEWKPDFIAIWNINFDLPRIIDALEREGYDINDVFCDPSVPPEFRTAEYVEGKTFQYTEDGKKKNLAPSEQWHVMNAPASFYWIDAMCVYRIIRMAAGKEKSYGLDYTLEKNLGERKLNFAEAEGVRGTEWHKLMQSKFKIMYMIYNLFDCIGVEKLDEKTLDLRVTISMQNKFNAYQIYPRQPARMANNLYRNNLKKGKVTLSSPGDMTTKADGYVVGVKDWISTLATHMRTDGLRIIDKMHNHATYIYAHVYDLDVSAAYPTGQEIMNIAMETTLRERYRLGDLDEFTARRVSLDLVTARQNAYEICRTAMNAKSFSEVLDDYNHDKMKKAA